MRLFIKVGSRDKLINLVKEGGGFQTVERMMDSILKQLITIKKQFEGDAGVTKEVLPGGIIKCTDKDGTVIIREPFPHEIENN